MSELDPVTPVYLGDAVYASFDGHHIQLHLNTHTEPPLIAIELGVFDSLVTYAKHVWGLQEASRPPTQEEQAALEQLFPPPTPVRVSPLAPSALLFNALMEFYQNPVRAEPIHGITKTMQDACRAAGILDEEDAPTKPTGIIIQ